ncbi:MAG TPA: branched-chain amino acid ABC transporter permease [Stellaceae bacterium]|nr:branched-chain amino acid ABC transporter permease [Stellaceae bacterium]
MLIALALVSGLGLGSMYGLLALGFSVTYAVSGTVNFAQGSSMMLGAVLCYSFAVTLGWPPLAAILLALLLCGFWGVIVERIAVRPFAARGSNGWLMATVALGIILENATLFLFGREPRNYPSVLADTPLDLAGIPVLPLQLAIPAVGLAAAAVLHLLARGTRLGKALLAVAQNQDAARLMGIDVGRAIALAYAVSTVFAGIAGILIAPLFNVSSDMGTLFGIKAFAVAIVGGIASPWGVVLAGFCYGAVEAMITALFGSTYTQILTFAVVILALAAMPNGLLGAAGTRKL